jgi:hypothetical protein
MIPDRQYATSAEGCYSSSDPNDRNSSTEFDRHHRQGQQLDTGFAASQLSFYRELNRGMDWIFTNHAIKLRAIRQQFLCL